MRPILYAGDETLFTSEGRGRLADCTRCIVTEERNGIYLCEFDYPVTGPMYAALLEGGIVGAIHDDNHDIQPFDIYGHTAPLDGIVTFYARHISYRLSNIILKPMTASSCAAALAAFESQTYNRNPFTFWTDKAVSGTWVNDVPASVKSRLVGEQGSILDVYGKGEYKYDKWTVRLYVNRGNDNGVSIRYGVNLTDLTEDVDSSSSYSAVAPYWKSSDGTTVVTLPEGYVVADNVPVKRYPWTTETGEIITTEDGTPIEFAVAQIMPVPLDLSSDFTEEPTVEQLRALAKTRLNNSQAWQPNTNIRISFVDLAHTEDYKDVAALQRVSLCDRVNVYCAPLGVSAAKVEVIRVVYNVLTEQYDEMELGQPSQTYAETVMAGVQQLVADRPTTSMMAAAIGNATQQITGAKDSHITFVYDANGGLQEILVMDTDNINTAQKVWRWNLGGLGYSSNGYAGPYTTAITQDGQIVADFITTGTMLANIIKGGTLTLGGLNNSSGVMQVLDGNGNVIGEWSRNGLSINKGNIYLDYTNVLQVGFNSNNTQYARFNNDGMQLRLSGNTIIGTGIFATSPSSPIPSTQIGRLYTQVDSEDRKLRIDAEIVPGKIDCGLLERNENDVLVSKRYLYYDMDSFIINDIVNSSSFRVYFKTTPTELNGLRYIGDFARFTSNVYVSNDFSVTGTKSRLVTTDQYSDRLLYCYETPSPMFGDVGEGVIGADGMCYVTIDPVFAQTITASGYQVFLQRYGDGDAYVSQRRAGWFVVTGTPGLPFGWEIKAKQRDYDQRRIDRNDEPFTVPAQTYGADAAAYITDLKKARISA